MQEMHETQVQSLSQEDTLEYGVATHSTIVAWKILCPNSWTEKSGGQQSMECRVRPNWAHAAQFWPMNILGYKLKEELRLQVELRNQFTLN